MSSRKNVTAEQLLDLAKSTRELLDDKKALRVVLMDLSRVNSYFDYFVIAVGNSQMHCRALAREAEKMLREAGLPQRNRPDLQSRWIVLDFNDLVVHIFTEDMYGYYQLEKLWSDAEFIG